MEHAGTETILVVDNDAAAANLHRNILSGEFDVRVVCSGEEAVERICSEHPPSLILLELALPGIGGLEVLQQIHGRCPGWDLPVVVVTSRPRPDLEERALELGAVDFMGKPVCPQVLRARVHAHLRVSHRTTVLEDLIGRDPLTQIANRRRFDEALEREWRRCGREGAPLSVAFADVDHFKLFNDHYGHAAGDECLRRVARALSDCLGRATDLVARYGGEEFAALLPGTDRTGAGAIARRFRAQVASLAIPHPGSVHGGVVTLSVGVATTPVPTMDTPAHALMCAADRLLYVAKQCGRNRVAHGDLRVDDEISDQEMNGEVTGVRLMNGGHLVLLEDER